MDPQMILDLVQRFGVVPTIVALVYVHVAVRPVFVDLRATCVELIGLARASAKKIGVTDDEIATESKVAEAHVPQIPDVPAASLLSTLNSKKAS